MSSNRDGWPTVDPTFKMPVVSEPPTEPATPPHPMDKAREQRENNRRDERTVERRAKALELAIIARVADVPLLETADSFLNYIENGRTPA
jgi:hypothetical protein